MPKPSPEPKRDPMSGVVDRLLAQLPGLQDGPPSVGGKARAAGQWTTATVPNTSNSGLPGSMLAVWARVLLGLALGIMMGAWPYQKGCGQPLAGYLAATFILMLAGLWAASSAWKHRAALAHVIALITLFYAILLAAAEFLPRVGYAMQQAHWQCEDVARSPVLSMLPSASSVGLHRLSEG